MSVKITLDETPVCPRCGDYGGVVTAVEPNYIDVDDGYGPRLVGYEPTAWDYCDCDYGRYLKAKADKRQAEEDAWIEREAARAADEMVDCGGGW